MSLRFLSFTANSEPENILLNILVIAGWKVEPNGFQVLHKACHLEICMQLKRNFEYENKGCSKVFCMKFVGSLCILKSFFFGGGDFQYTKDFGGNTIQAILKYVMCHCWKGLSLIRFYFWGKKWRYKITVS